MTADMPFTIGNINISFLQLPVIVKHTDDLKCKDKPYILQSRKLKNLT